jgi:Flp pilus assembly pilin Flp
MKHLARLIHEYVPQRENGQGLVEYGLILATISIPVVVTLFAVAPRI